MPPIGKIATTTTMSPPTTNLVYETIAINNMQLHRIQNDVNNILADVNKINAFMQGFNPFN
jgi:hypothetical protein